MALSNDVNETFVDLESFSESDVLIFKEGKLSIVSLIGFGSVFYFFLMIQVETLFQAQLKVLFQRLFSMMKIQVLILILV